MLKQKLERDDVSTKFPLRDESVSPARASVRRGDDRQERHQEEKTDVITASAAAQMPLRPANAAKSSTNEIACFATETDRSGLFIGPIAGRWRGHFCLGSGAVEDGGLVFACVAKGWGGVAQLVRAAES